MTRAKTESGINTTQVACLLQVVKTRKQARSRKGEKNERKKKWRDSFWGEILSEEMAFEREKKKDSYFRETIWAK